MPRFLTLVYCFLCIHIAADAQIETPVLKPDEIMVVKLKSAETGRPPGTSISAVEILDARDDTSSAGYYTSQSRRTSKIIFSGPAAAEITTWMNGYFGLGNNGTSGNTIFGVIRKLRVSDEITPKTFDNGHQGQARNGWDRGVMIKMEYYIRKDSLYYPLYRFDSLLVFDEKLYDHAGEFITNALEASLNKLYGLNIDIALARSRKISAADILNKIRLSYNQPVLNDVVYKKGIYASFNEFKTNNPSITDYEFKKGQLGDILYVKKDGLEYPERTAWGFCDGKNIYINSGDKFSQLIRVGNTFDFKGIKSITKLVTRNILKTSLLNLATNTGERITNFNARLKYFQVDMETGDVY